MRMLAPLPVLALTLAALTACSTLRVDPVGPQPFTLPTAVTVAPVELSGLFGYGEWNAHWQSMAESLAQRAGFAVVTTPDLPQLRFYLSDKTFVRGYQTLHSLYASLDLVDAQGVLVKRVIYSEESIETLESSHKLYLVMERCLEGLVQGAGPRPKSTNGA